MADDDDDEEEEDEDEDAEEDGGYWGPTRRKAKQWYEPVTIPREAGVNLERSGEFGPVRFLFLSLSLLPELTESF